MFDYIVYLSMIYIIMSCLICSFFYKHILLMLISLEFLMLSGVYSLYNLFMFTGMSVLFLYLYMMVMIGESVLGVTILITMVRANGNDYYKSLSLLK